MRLSKASVKKVDDLLDLLKKFHSPEGSTPELLIKFQDRYREISPEERPWFFEEVIARFEIDKKEIEDELYLLSADEGKDSLQWRKSLSNLRQKINSPRIQIFRNFLNSSGGLKFLPGSEG
jgi:hypothetical protein